MADHDEHDVVIIGAGISGLFAGNYLVRRGLSVLILEGEDQAGGYIRGFWRGGFYFNAGVQSFSSNGILFPALRQLALESEMEFEKVDYRWVTPWADFRVDSVNEVVRAVAAAFPESQRQITGFFRAIEPWTHGARRLETAPNPLLSAGWQRLPAMLRFALHNLDLLWLTANRGMEPGLQFARRYFDDPTLADFFGRFGYEGAPAIAAAGAWGSWLYDYWTPRGGMRQLAETLVKRFTKLGGEIRYNTFVDQIIMVHGAARGVSSVCGEKFPAKRVVHAGDVREMVTKLIPRSAVSDRWRDLAIRTPVSDTLFTAYLGVDIPRSQLRNLMGAYHVFVQPSSTPLPGADAVDADTDPDLHARRWVEVTAPSLLDQETEENGRSSLILQCLSRYEWQERWGSGPDEKSTPKYRALKTRVAEQLIATAEKVIPGLAGRVVVCDAATPLTKARRTQNAEGATAGWTWDPRRNPIRGILGRYRTPVSGLYQVGHWTARIGGVPAAVLSAKVVADVVAKELKR